MKQDSGGNGAMSMFSLNTTLLGQANPLHAYYNRIFPEQNYPHLTKILFLQLVLRENILLYSPRRAEVK